MLWSFDLFRYLSLFNLARWIALFSLSLSTTTYSATAKVQGLFSEFQQSILQVRVIDIASGSKSAIGSGFVVDSRGLVATNYHVVEKKVSKPGKFRVQYLTSMNQIGELHLVDVDVINDLALLKTADIQLPALKMITQEPNIGEPVYALGNPMDLGLTLVPGTYNGVLKGSYYPRMHFTGSLNPGMSGGATLDTEGRVVGINVASAGNQVGFLVPIGNLQKLLDEYRDRGQAVANMQLRIRDQLLEDQDNKFSKLLEMPWQSIRLGEADVLRELSPFVKCWGGSNSSDTKAEYLMVDRTCRSQDEIFLNSTFNTGSMEYQFFWLQAHKLNSWRFYNFYQKLFQDFIPGNKASEDDVTNFECQEGFTRVASVRQYKTLFCLRAYKDYPDLYDVLFLQGTVDDAERAFISHFTLAGVSKSRSLDFTQRFMEYSQWR